MADSLPPPLHGVRVLELAHLIAGPICGMYLADMGADVVKVESRDAPDAGRSVYPRAVRNGEGVLHLTVNRNKRGISLDVKRPEGRAAFRRLAGWADVIIEGFRGGVAERLGIDYDSLKDANPRLIYCSISAFGPDGPWREKPGLDSLAQALGGLMAITGEPDGTPVLCGAPVADTLGGMLAIQGILTALIARGASGPGQRVDASLFQTGIMLMAYHLVYQQFTGAAPEPQGSRHSAFAPYGAFPTADGTVMIGISGDGMFERLCAALGKPWDADPRYHSPAIGHPGRSPT